VFRGLINDAKSAASSIILKYVARASVAVPFVISLGFGLAAATMMLAERYGQQNAYWMMAGGLAVIGLVATLFVTVKEHEEEVADEKAAAVDTSNVASDMAAQAPYALIGGLLTLPGGPSTMLKVAKVLGKNYALVLLLVVLGALFWPKKPSEAQLDDDIPSPIPLQPTARVVVSGGRVRNGTSAWMVLVAVGVSVAMVAGVAFVAAPGETQQFIADIGWR
jgi:uncharacterized membrane protein